MNPDSAFQRKTRLSKFDPVAVRKVQGMSMYICICIYTIDQGISKEES
jgi:hypothetical protein